MPVEEDKKPKDEFLFEEDESVEGERKEVERAVSRLRERIKRRGKKKKRRQRVGVKGPIPSPRKRTAPTASDQGKQVQPPPDEEIESRNWLSLGWMANAAINGHKTLTLKPWSESEASQYNQGDLLDLFDDPPSRGGKKLGIIRLTQSPFQIRTDELSKTDLSNMGFDYFRAYNIKSPGRVSMEEIENSLKENQTKLWAVHFKLERLVDDTAPTRGTIKVSE